MKPGSDGEASVSEVLLCEIAGVLRPTRRKWADRGLLSKKTSYVESDVIDCAVLDRLTTLLGSAEGPLAWHQVRGVMCAQDSLDLDLVFDLQYKEAYLSTDPGTIGARLRHGRPVRIVHLGTPLAEIRQAFKRASMLA